MDYLTGRRTLVTEAKVTNSSEPISAIARSLGYESESAFGTAFKRVMGSSPRQYNRGRKAATAAHREEEAARAEQLEAIES